MKKIILLLVLIVCGSIAAYLYLDTDPPEITWDVAENAHINDAFKVQVTDDVSLKEVCAILSGGSCVDVETCSKELGTQSFDLLIEPAQCAANSKPFPLKISVQAMDTSIIANKASATLEVTYDKQPPNLVTLKGTRYMKRGGTGLVLYEVSEQPEETGVMLDELLFRAFEFSENRYLSFYAHPYSVEPNDFKPRVFAVDKAGNAKKIRPGSRTGSRTYHAETIKLSDDFLESVKDKMMPESNQSPLEVFIQVNNTTRQENRQKIVQLCRNTEPEKLWDGVFLRNQGAPKAGFADSRTYKYGSEAVDQQVHTGIDIAGVNNTPIVAANHGKVIFVGEIGIYGNVVVLDHGYGIHSLYGHLNQSNVQEGDRVEKGEQIATSGESGLAFGDHLHFEIRVNGIPVNPVEWFDKAWIDNNIEPFLPGVAEEG